MAARGIWISEFQCAASTASVQITLCFFTLLWKCHSPFPSLSLSLVDVTRKTNDRDLHNNLRWFDNDVSESSVRVIAHCSDSNRAVIASVPRDVLLRIAARQLKMFSNTGKILISVFNRSWLCDIRAIDRLIINFNQNPFKCIKSESFRSLLKIKRC